MALLVSTAGGAKAITRIPNRCADRVAPRLCAIHWHHKRTNQARRRLSKPPLPYHWIAEAHPNLRDRILSYWMRTDLRSHERLRTVLRARAASPWPAAWLNAALCVHSHEGAWNSNTGNGYYGGMQFDLSTWASYGGVGRPDLASPHEQLLIAYRAWQARGWSPWPNTSAMCGL